MWKAPSYVNHPAIQSVTKMLQNSLRMAGSIPPDVYSTENPLGLSTPDGRTRAHFQDAEKKAIMEHDVFTEKDTVLVPQQDQVSVISGVPQEHLKSRHVRIFVPPKNAMQSGSHGVKNWRIEFDSRERWENPLMGWCSTGDPLSNSTLEFDSADSAAAYCKRMGWDFHVDEPNRPILKAKSYGANFSWNKRTRRSTK